MIGGHAMKVPDYENAQGAILGKAISSLSEGEGTRSGSGVSAIAAVEDKENTIMTSCHLRTVQPLLVMAIVCTAGARTHAQLWRDFAHTDDPHRLSYDAPASIPPLIDDPSVTIAIPVLVVLLQFSDVSGQAAHTAGFFKNFVFGMGYNDGAVDQPSLRQIIEANSNGRVTIVPALESHGTSSDGLFGWVTTQCPPGITGGGCTAGPAQGQQCSLNTAGACEAGGGQCVLCDSWDYYRFNDWKKRAEAIRRADPDVPFSIYDLMDNDWVIGSDGIVTDNEIAVVVIDAWPNAGMATTIRIGEPPGAPVTEPYGPWTRGR